MISSVNAANAYQRATVATQASGPAAGAARTFEEVMNAADRNAVGAMSGTADTHTLVQSLTEAELALDAALAIRDKVVEAYQEILRMPV
ncbi:flagellar hook-basal body complex protein FliE [Paracoccus sp. SCSIO 75233]|uniref:flagellar hook-basal body complex protein FliE n=1 Tax=Paracoccus sp. SCSIO 75233 TaxID=3017782 RepID=UPI0022F067AC|nr:flagellar hook-basal body complex protein FliE [Paracoccus sp. SCSIO 75233]WBU53451.1 flagellar hook-basal body complex protein FliE [Paracoccus sp. SCSIO 75233]